MRSDVADPEGRALRALLDGIERSRDERIAAIEERSRIEARRIVQEARRRALERVREAAADARRKHREECERARAELATRSRQRRYAALRETAGKALGDLPGVLEARFADPTGRRSWIEGALRLAREKLPPGRPWSVLHAPEMQAEQLRELAAAIEALSGHHASLGSSSEVRAGIVIEAAGARLDATPAGFLRDRARIAGRVLGELLGDGAASPAGRGEQG